MAFTVPGGAASLVTQAATTADAATGGFQARVSAALPIVAFEVLNEAVTTANHTNRKALAAKVLTQPAQYMPGFATLFAGLICADLLTLTGCTDQALITRIEVVFDTMAGLGS